MMSSRVKSRVWRTLSIVAVMTLSASCANNPEKASEVAPNRSRDRNVATSTSSFLPPAPFVTDGSLLSQAEQASVSHEVAAPLMGWLSPLAVTSNDGQSLFYNSFDWLKSVDWSESFSAQGIETGDALGVPSVRRLDLLSGGDTLVAEGAFSVALRSDGALAWFQGDGSAYRANTPFVGRLVVDLGGGKTEAWTDSGRYVAVAWAGDTLLAYQELEGETHDLLAIDGPNDARVLLQGADLVALDPDGTQAFVATASYPPTASIVDVSSGKEIASLDLTVATDGNSGLAAERLAYAGSWLGNSVVAESAGGLTVFSVSSGVIAVKRILQFPVGEYPFPPHEPRFVGDEETIVLWLPVPGHGGKAEGREYVYALCDVSSLDCQVSAELGDKILNAAFNPSRPGGAE